MIVYYATLTIINIYQHFGVVNRYILSNVFN